MDTETVATETVVATETAITEPKGKPGRPRESLTDKQLDKAVSFYMDRKNWSVARIAEWFKVEPATLYHHLRKDPRVVMRGKGRPGLSAEQAALVVERYNAGDTLSEIRKLSALTRRVGNERIYFAMPTLSAALKAAGITPKRGRRPEPVEAVEAEAAPAADVAADAPAELAPEALA